MHSKTSASVSFIRSGVPLVLASHKAAIGEGCGGVVIYVVKAAGAEKPSGQRRLPRERIR